MLGEGSKTEVEEKRREGGIEKEKVAGRRGHAKMWANMGRERKNRRMWREQI